MPSSSKTKGLFRVTRSPFWQYDFQCGGVRFSGSTKKKNEREAAAVLRTLRGDAKRRNASRRVDGDITMNVAAARFYEENAKFLTDGDDTDRNLERLVEFFGPGTSLADAANGTAAKKLSELVARRRADTYGKFKKKLVSNATVNRSVIDCFSRLVNHARDAWHLEDAIKAPKFGKLRLPEADERARELSDDEYTALANAIRPDYLDIMEFAALVGMRKANVVYLTWPQIDFERCVARIRIKSSLQGGRWHTVPIPSAGIEILRRQRGLDPTQVFTYEAQRGRDKGARRPMTGAGVRQAWDKAREKAGVTDLKWHDWRHHFATNLLRNADRSNLKTVQRALGHRSIASTVRYAHVELDDVAAAMEQASRCSKPRKKSRTNDDDGENLNEKKAQ